jgi:hypothetical protein
MRLIALALALFALSGAVIAGKAPAELTGLFGNVRMSAETGDLGGQELRFFKDADTGQAMVEFVDCEGWCNEAHRVPLMRDEKGAWFQYSETLNDDDGNIMIGEARRYRIARKGRNLILTGIFPNCADCSAMGPYKLKPLKQSFGIAVANNEP